MSNSILKSDQKKFNIFLGEFLNKLSNTPTTQMISKELFAMKKKDYVLINNNLSLPELSQNLLDDIILEKDEIFEILNKLFSKNSKYNNSFHKALLDSNLFSTIISSNYDSIFEDYFFDLLNKQTPFSINKDEVNKISFYKLYGDFNIPDKFVLSTQDIKRLKILDFYTPFWRKISDDLCKNPTILFGINFSDSTILGILEFIFSKIKKQHQPVYLYSDTAINSEITQNFIDTYSITVIEGKMDEFLNIIKNYFPDLQKEEGDAPLMEYA